MTNMSSKGITPVVATVLLLMMTVAAAGGAYVWFTNMQDQFRQRAEGEIQTELSVRDLQCDADDDTIEIALSNSGSTEVALEEVDVFIRGSGGNLNATFTEEDWTGTGFSDPGGFGSVTLDMANTDSGSDFLVAGSFYKVETYFANTDYTLSVGGCLAETG
ncbi:MAG: archaellin/type IV pilin N-terminal domain-containing protein [Candidatus Nanohaloarchaea archaeon]|nr:archaellin/type IV pilin N-terminal domain-containing protein [Candidatus Nanohaloarchaea archaeon]